MAYNSKLGYDPDRDYSVALSNSNLTAGERAQLTQERQNKINDVYGGVEPGYNNTGSTFSQLYGANGAGTSPATYSGAGSSGYDANPNFDYSNYINGLMNAGSTDYAGLEALLNERTAKAVNTTGLGQYANDAFAQSVRDYINKGKAAQDPQADYQALLEQYMPAVPQYQSNDTLYRQLVQKAIDQDYDTWTQSDQYKALADRYGNQGKMTMQDVLGQVASRTGGLASSYATTAAQQQYNDYMAMLEQAARQQYSEDYNDLVDKVGMAKNLSDYDYQKYLDQLAQYNNDRSYAFDVLSEALGQSNWAKQWQNTLDQQAWQRQQAEDKTAYDRGQDAQKAAQDQILTYVSMGQMPPDALIESSGWDRDYVSLLMAGKQQSGGPSNGGTPQKATVPQKQLEYLEAAAERGTSAEGIYDLIMGWVKSGAISKEQGNLLAEKFGY